MHPANELIRLGADLNAQDKKGKTPLHLALRLEMHDLADVMIKNGADKNIQDKEGKTPLMLIEDLLIEKEKILKEPKEVITNKGDTTHDFAIEDLKKINKLKILMEGEKSPVEAVEKARKEARSIPGLLNIAREFFDSMHGNSSVDVSKKISPDPTKTKNSSKQKAR